MCCCILGLVYNRVTACVTEAGNGRVHLSRMVRSGRSARERAEHSARPPAALSSGSSPAPPTSASLHPRSNPGTPSTPHPSASASYRRGRTARFPKSRCPTCQPSVGIKEISLLVYTCRTSFSHQKTVRTHREEVQSVFLVHVHVHHLQQLPHLFESHLPVFVFVGFLKPVPDPPEERLRKNSSSEV